VVDLLDLRPGDRVLDAGCGVGGASRYVVERFGIETVGIVNSDRLVEAARAKSSRLPGKERLEFENRDYTRTGFPDSHFSKVFAIESVCYAVDKASFIREAYRLLKEGGRLIVADGFRLKADLSEEEKRKFAEWLHGWYLPELASVETFRAGLESAGFSGIEYRDKTDAVVKSSKRIYLKGRRGLLLQAVPRALHITPESWYRNATASVRQRYCIERGIWGYGIFSARK
jgi:cyclopropane fatty-acyl-phospholipid synthase-like methyltransferase